MEITIIGFTIVGIILIGAAFLKDRKIAQWITKGDPSELTRDIRNHI